MRSANNLCREAIPHRSMFILCIAVLLLLTAVKAYASQDPEQYKITYLLNTIGSCDLVFLSNGKEYTGKEAKAHLQKKLYYAGDRIHTVEDFITHIASRSYFTDTPYHVRFADGTELETGKWLHGILAKMGQGEDR